MVRGGDRPPETWEEWGVVGVQWGESIGAKSPMLAVPPTPPPVCMRLGDDSTAGAWGASQPLLTNPGASTPA